MELEFFKMNGAGNDFVLIFAPPEGTAASAAALCDRRTGIGADGLILLFPVPGRRNVFRMEFYNNDGSRAGMCGNGLRCAGLFASRISGMEHNLFLTDSGALTAEVLAGAGSRRGQVRIAVLNNQPFRDFGMIGGFHVYFGVAGVPHAVVPVADVAALDIVSVGRMLRNHPAFAPDGTNVDFVETAAPPYRIRTYERGVEDETPACGTGIVSSGLVLHQFFGKDQKVCFLSRSNAELEVEILQDCNILKENEMSDRVYLTGPAEESFRGTVCVEMN